MVQIISGHVLIFVVTVLSVHMKLHSEEMHLTKCDFHLQVDMRQGAVQSLFLSNDQQPAALCGSAQISWDRRNARLPSWKLSARTVPVTYCHKVVAQISYQQEDDCVQVKFTLSSQIRTSVKSSMSHI